MRNQQSSFVMDLDPGPSGVTELRKDKPKAPGKDKRDRERHTRRREADARDLRYPTRLKRSSLKTNANARRICENETSFPSALGSVIKTRPRKSLKTIRPGPRVPQRKLLYGDNLQMTRLHAPSPCLPCASTPVRSISQSVSTSRWGSSVKTPRKRPPTLAVSRARQSVSAMT